MILALLRVAASVCMMFLTSWTQETIRHPSVQTRASLNPTRVFAFCYAKSYAGSIESRERKFCAQASWKNKMHYAGTAQSHPPLRTSAQDNIRAGRLR